MKYFEISGTVPSVNHCYSVNRFGKRFLNANGIQFKHDLGWVFKQFNPGFQVDATTRYHLDIEIHLRKYNKKGEIHKVNHKRNIDNCLKVLLDGLEEIMYVDDLQVDKITIQKFLGNEDNISVGWEVLKCQ